MPVAGYFICATPRSGSTLLCDLLKQTGVAGRPNSFYRRESVDGWVRRFGIEPGDGLAFERRYLAATIKEGTGETGLFGMRLHGLSLFELLGRLAMLFPAQATDGERLAAAFGTTLYIRLRRDDKVAQAISRVKAEQSGLWHRSADGAERERVKPNEAPVYDAGRIAAHVAETEAHEGVWDDWATGQGITPLDVHYELLAADPVGTLAQVLGALGRDPGIAAGVAVQTARLADGQSAAWAERYRAEQGR